MVLQLKCSSDMFGPYFCHPFIAGLGENDQPFICTMDCIGAKELAKDLVVSGTAPESLYGACESMCKPDMEPEGLFEKISQALLSSVDRACPSGWGGYALTMNLKNYSAQSHKHCCLLLTVIA